MPLKIFIIFALILFTIPRVTYDTIAKINENRHQASYTLSQNELNALSFLNTLPPGIVLTPMEDCLYPRIFTNNHVFYCNDAAVLTDHASAGSINIVDKLHLKNYADLNRKTLEQNNITYVYIRTKMKYPVADHLKTIYQNTEILIKEVKPRSGATIRTQLFLTLD